MTKKNFSFVFLIFLIVVIVFLVFFGNKKIMFVMEKNTPNKVLVSFVTPLENEEVNNPFLVKVKINNGLESVYKVKVYDLEANLLYEDQLYLEDGYWLNFVKIAASNKILRDGFIQIYRLDKKDNAQILLAKQPIRFKDGSPGLTNADLLGEKRAFVRIKNKEFKAEVANTLEARTIGLSGRLKMSEEEAMLFVFDSPGYHSFWMKNMKFDIDIIWIYYDTIVYIEEKVKHPQNQDSDLELYSSNSKANMVLEVIAGTSSKYGFSVGDRVYIYK